MPLDPLRKRITATPTWNSFAESSTGTALLSLDRRLKSMTRVELLLLVGGLQLIWACMVVGLFAETPVGLKTIGMIISLAGVLLNTWRLL